MFHLLIYNYNIYIYIYIVLFIYLFILRIFHANSTWSSLPLCSAVAQSTIQQNVNKLLSWIYIFDGCSESYSYHTHFYPCWRRAGKLSSAAFVWLKFAQGHRALQVVKPLGRYLWDGYDAYVARRHPSKCRPFNVVQNGSQSWPSTCILFCGR